MVFNRECLGSCSAGIVVHVVRVVIQHQQFQESEAKVLIFFKIYLGPSMDFIRFCIKNKQRNNSIEKNKQAMVQ